MGLPATAESWIEVDDQQLISDSVRTALGQVEDLLVTEISNGPSIVVDKALHLVNAGGKRFRPLFTIMSAQLGPHPDDPQVVTAAAVAELTHLASLYHDDVIDEAPLRRGVVSANARWNNTVAILAGDYLLATAFRLATQIDGKELEQMVEDTLIRMLTGEMRESIGVRPDEDPVAHYMDVIRDKTGALIEACAGAGATFSGATSDEVERLRKFGNVLGLIFQISDDLLDLVADQQLSGKELGTDLREGVHTLPVLFALRAQGTEADRLRRLLSHPLESEAEVAEALRLVARSPGIAETVRVLDSLKAEAESLLAALPRGAGNDALRQLVEMTVERVR
ncbi:polyprenyl synthetase family protein [Nocardia transvalensis]|uniref:polyprenyl synthetase family protein n=1 Tax=Nocardia transvalensis TaxID=37333 RepID=UPI001893A7D7|nr:polyprenyl synthetase family protein [Nocardia transvalensis]MBF6331951.1 polyprenyl synthetase family protein [Nocardia transvalensis]